MTFAINFSVFVEPFVSKGTFAKRIVPCKVKSDELINCKPAGNTSRTSTLVASLGPELFTVMV